MKPDRSHLRPALICLGLLAGCLSLLVAAHAHPVCQSLTPIYVDAGTSTTGTHDGLSWGTAFATLDPAIAAQSAGGSIWVAEGSYVPTSQANGFAISKSLNLYGGFKGPHPSGTAGESTLSARHGSFLSTILEGDTAGDDLTLGLYDDNARHLISIDGTAGGVHVVVDGFKIERGYCNLYNQTHGYTADDGAGIKDYLADLDVANCTLERNFARNGGGIWISGGIVFPPAQGAGVFPALQVKLSEFLYDTADVKGGGIFADIVTDSWVVNSRFDACLATSGGGGTYVRAVKDTKSFDFTNCVFWQNLSNTNGGALRLDDSGSGSDSFSKSRVVNCTLVGNFIASCVTGQAVDISSNSTCGIYNSIVYYNYDISSTLYTTQLPIANAGTLTVEYSDVFNNGGGAYTGSGNMDSTPLFTTGNPPAATSFPYTIGPLFTLTRAGSTQYGSDCIDAADYGRLPDDLGDLDEDGVTTGQKLPVDLLESNRFVDRHGLGETDAGAPSGSAYLDMGAYERP